jgi:DNA-binding transcriptional LysR family regulator
MLGLAAQTRRSLGDSEPSRLTVAAAPMVAEDIVPWLLDAFTARQPGLETGTLAVAPSAFVELLRDRRADVALGPRPPLGGTPPISSTPFLRFSLVVVAAPDRARHLRQPVPAAQLARQPWLVGPEGADRGTLTGDYLAALAVDPKRVSTYPSDATALQLVSEGQGVTLSFRHSVRPELQRGSLVALEVATPAPSGLLYASTLGADRCSPAAAALCRFIATPTATQAVLLRSGGRPAKQFKPPVYVTLWS